MNIDISEIAGGRQLWYAEKGSSVRQAVSEIIRSNKHEKMFALDFKDVEVADTSFIREAFVKLLHEQRMETNRPQILFKNVSEYMIENLDASFSKHNHFTMVATGDQWDIIGKASQQLKQTLRIILSKKECTAKQLASDLKINMTAANNRLSKLLEMSVVSRTETSQQTGGKEFIYRAES